MLLEKLGLQMAKIKHMLFNVQQDSGKVEIQIINLIKKDYYGLIMVK